MLSVRPSRNLAVWLATVPWDDASGLLVQLAVAPERSHVGRREAFGLSIAFWMMLGNAFIMSVGFFMLIPLASVHYTTTLGFTAASVGLALAIRQFSQQ